MASAPRHLLTVWNPSYAADALDEHLRLLLDWSERHRQGRVGEDEVYVWWAKIRNAILGIGCEGLLVRVAQIRRRAG